MGAVSLPDATETGGAADSFGRFRPEIAREIAWAILVNIGGVAAIVGDGEAAVA
jgi:hypothetical protein